MTLRRIGCEQAATLRDAFNQHWPGPVTPALHGRLSMYILYVHRSSALLIMRTRIFKSGNSLAVRIPKELAIAGVSEEVEIERVGNTLVLRPAQRKGLAGVGEIFAMFSPDFMSEGREFHEELERDWGAAGISREGV